LNLKEVKNVLRECGVRPNKRLGQNFLIDKNIQKKIIESAGLDKKDIVFEIGPGLGALTEEISKRVKKVIAIEKDSRLFDFLLKHTSLENLKLEHGDFLKYEFTGNEKIKIIGNLPYYISSPILIKILNERAFVHSAFITVQKEFAKRVVALPGSKTYGSISCFTQFYSRASILFTIKKNTFYPVPKVDSCFLKLVTRPSGLYLTDEEKLFKIIRTCFEKRRKTILNSLSSSREFVAKKEALETLERAGIAPSRRPETLSLEEFVRITNIRTKERR